jgi:hypothetical protein
MVQQSNHHPTFSQLGELQVNQVDIKDGFLELPINQNAFVTEFLPNDYDKPNLQDLVNKITGLTESDISRLQMYHTNVIFGMPDQGQMLDV